MLDKSTIWRKRVAGWRASGETAAVYSARNGFTTSSLRYWASRLRREEAMQPPVVRLAQLVRTAQPASAAVGGTIAIELQDARARVIVGAEVDRAALATVLEVLEQRRGR